MKRFRTWFQLMMVPVFVLAASACGTGAETPAPLSAPAPVSAPIVSPEGPSWNVQLLRQCADGVSRDTCQGAYGFTIASDGVYKVGPGPGGEIISGSLEASEIKGLGEMARRATAPCVQDPGSPAPKEQMLVVLGGEGTQSCDSSLLAKAKTLLKKYHPAVFPTPCLSAAHELEKSYAVLTRCERSADCAYLDTSFFPADPNRPSAPIADDCSVIKPLIVANSFEATANQLKLLMKRDLAKKVCGSEFLRPSCSSPLAHHSTMGPPACVAGICRVQP